MQKTWNILKLTLVVFFIFIIWLNKFFWRKKNLRLLIPKKKEYIWPKDNNNLEEIKKYFTDCENGILYSKNAIPQTKIETPKVSIIILAYNISKYIRRVLRSIQNQSLKELDIIFAEDCSKDNTIQLINDYSKVDKRIRMIKNEKNLGSFKTRRKGVGFSKAKYIQFIDADDLLVNDILEKAYNTAIKTDVDVVQYLFVQGVNKNLVIHNDITTNDIIYQPGVADLLYFGKGYLEQTNFFIWDKIIEKKAIANAFEFMGEDILKERLEIFDDQFLLFCLLRTAKSLKFINHIGYYYFRGNAQSITDSIMKPEQANGKIRTVFIIAKFFYEASDNSPHDKGSAYMFFTIYLNFLYSLYNKNIRDQDLVKNVFDLFLNSPFYDEQQKINIKNVINNYMNHK